MWLITSSNGQVGAIVSKAMKGLLGNDNILPSDSTILRIICGQVFSYSIKIEDTRLEVTSDLVYPWLGKEA